MASLPWYKEGLKFGCTQCGKCCTGGPGAVWISSSEAQAIAAHLEVTTDHFYHHYCRKLNGKWALQEKGAQYDCIFLQAKACAIYPVRPLQCQTFPFWPGTLSSSQAWQEAAHYCEGIRADAPLIPLACIEQTLNRHQ